MQLFGEARIGSRARVWFVFVVIFLHNYYQCQAQIIDNLWENYKDKYDKEYVNKSREQEGKENFVNNVIDVMVHNMDNTSTYLKGTNKYSDMDPKEAIEKLCTYEPYMGNETKVQKFLIETRSAPDSINWFDLGKVTSVKDQGSCGACTAESVVAAVESAHAIKWNYLRDLSVQQVVDCAGTGGCGGGNNELNYDYLKTTGLQKDSCYPYVAKEQKCAYEDKCNGAFVKDYVRISPYGDEQKVKEAVAAHGPQSIGIHVSDNMVQYKSGIFSDPSCGTQGINHALLLVGYGQENGLDYWLIKNNWGTSWGQQGYMKLARNQNNMCQVATDVTYPIVY